MQKRFISTAGILAANVTAVAPRHSKKGADLNWPAPFSQKEESEKSLLVNFDGDLSRFYFLSLGHIQRQNAVYV